jgi:nucleotide-binding universal stress UspA family protein
MSNFPTEILLATDGSEEASLDTQAATELSKETGSEVHLVYVLPTPAQLLGPHHYSEEIRDSLIGGGREGRLDVPLAHGEAALSVCHCPDHSSDHQPRDHGGWLSPAFGE